VTPNDLARVALLLGVVGISVPASCQEFPRGNYASVVNGLPSEIDFAEDGRQIVRIGSDTVIVGKYEVKNDTLIVRHIGGRSACARDEGGLYTWRVVGTSLAFTLITDACLERRDGMSQHTWDRVPSPGLALGQDLSAVHGPTGLANRHYENVGGGTRPIAASTATPTPSNRLSFPGNASSSSPTGNA
jgi:hypothetical protein